MTVSLSFSQVRDLPPLERLKLTLYFGLSPGNDLKPLEQLKGLQQLTLKLNGQVRDLNTVRELRGLQTLSIEDATRAQRMSLRNIPAGLVELKF